MKKAGTPFLVVFLPRTPFHPNSPKTTQLPEITLWPLRAENPRHTQISS